MIKKLKWRAYCSDDRNKAIEEIKAAISNNDGCIMNFNIYSDLAPSLILKLKKIGSVTYLPRLTTFSSFRSLILGKLILNREKNG